MNQYQRKTNASSKILLKNYIKQRFLIRIGLKLNHLGIFLPTQIIYFCKPREI